MLTLATPLLLRPSKDSYDHTSRLPASTFLSIHHQGMKKTRSQNKWSLCFLQWGFFASSPALNCWSCVILSMAKIKEKEPRMSTKTKEPCRNRWANAIILSSSRTRREIIWIDYWHLEKHLLHCMNTTNWKIKHKKSFCPPFVLWLVVVHHKLRNLFLLC